MGNNASNPARLPVSQSPTTSRTSTSSTTTTTTTNIPKVNPNIPSPTREKHNTTRGKAPIHKSLRVKRKSLELPDLAGVQRSFTPLHPPSPSQVNGHYNRNPPKSASIPIPIPQAPLNQGYAIGESNRDKSAEREDENEARRRGNRKVWDSTASIAPSENGNTIGGGGGYHYAAHAGYTTAASGRVNGSGSREGRGRRGRTGRRAAPAPPPPSDASGSGSSYTNTSRVGNGGGADVLHEEYLSSQERSHERRHSPSVERVEEEEDGEGEEQEEIQPADSYEGEQDDYEIVHSTVPLTVGQAAMIVDPYDGEGGARGEIEGLIGEPPLSATFELTPVPTTITWRFGGTSVMLARAGDDDWNGRVEMERESPTSQIFSVTILLPPGTHHLRFVVDDVLLLAEDLPAAVDDHGELANYVAVPFPPSFPAHAIPPPPIPAVPPPPMPVSLSHSQPTQSQPMHVPGTNPLGNSFWNGNEDEEEDRDHDKGKGKGKEWNYEEWLGSGGEWGDDIPLELVSAAAEEEGYLGAIQQHPQAMGKTVVSGFVPAPSIPQPPSLPRHLEKLILNMRAPRPGAVGGAGSGTLTPPLATDRRRRGGATSSSSSSTGGGGRRGRGGYGSAYPYAYPYEGDSSTSTVRERERESVVRELPVTTASGTDVRQAQARAFGMTAAMASSPPASPTTPHVPPPSLTLTSVAGLISAPPVAHGAGTSTPPGMIADDASVLPVPSHVVLHHLSTTAFKNGVLAVGNTTRYRKKYLTTIYYKPA